MRVWDVHAGYLNRQSLLGEHRELHGILSILRHGKRGYARHPETLRWRGRLRALARRHEQLLAEMTLRGYRHESPVSRYGEVCWPDTFITPPGEQLVLLGAKYAGREPGRIPLPRSAQELWGHHKYSVLARAPTLSREIGRRVAGLRRRAEIDSLALELVLLLRVPPRPGPLDDALVHMWGHVRGGGRPPGNRSRLLAEIQRRALERKDPYLLASTAITDFACHLR